METLRKNATVIMAVVVVLIAIIGFGMRSEGRLSALESEAKSTEYRLSVIDDIQKEINNINIKLTHVETDIVWIKNNASTQTGKIDRILEKLENQ